MDDITSRFISVIYNATMSADTVADVESELDRLLFSGAENPYPAIEDFEHRSRLSEELRPHVDKANDIYKRINGDRAFVGSLAGLLEAILCPTLAVNSRGDVQSGNSLASRRGWSAVRGLADLGLDPTTRDEIAGFFAAAQNNDVFVRACCLDSIANHEVLLVVRNISSALSSATGGIFLLTLIDLDFDDQILARFGDAFRLTIAEREVVGYLVRGRSPKETAILRGTTEDTVRTQIKIIKSKTQTADLPALIRLFCGFLNTVSVPENVLKSEAEINSARRHNRRTESVILRCGRQVEVRFQGDPNGRPVLVFQNMPYGIELSAAAQEFCVRNRLQIIAPFRPGYGKSTTLSRENDEAYLTTISDDYAELLDMLGIRQVVVLAFSVGSVFALQFANKYPDRVRRLIGVSRVPVWRDSWLKATPVRQRVMLRIVRDFPSMAVLISGAALSHLNGGKLNTFVADSVRGSPSDELAIRDPETMNLMRLDIERGFENGMETFVRECRLTLLDRTELARQTQHKFHILHGDADKIVTLEQPGAFIREVPGSTLEVVPGGGQLMAYSHWKAHMTAVLRAWNASL